MAKKQYGSKYKETPTEELEQLQASYANSFSHRVATRLESFGKHFMNWKALIALVAILGSMFLLTLTNIGVIQIAIALLVMMTVLIVLAFVALYFIFSIWDLVKNEGKLREVEFVLKQRAGKEPKSPLNEKQKKKNKKK